MTYVTVSGVCVWCEQEAHSTSTSAANARRVLLLDHLKEEGHLFTGTVSYRESDVDAFIKDGHPQVVARGVP